MKTVVQVVGNHETVRFAATEFSRYMRRATGKPMWSARATSPRSVTFTIGICEDVGVPRPQSVTPDDDWICIEPRDRGYVLTGSNPRSVLYAVYRYLRELGFRWIRPGRRGEIIPRLMRATKRGISVDERPSYRYRTVCIEGSPSYEHVRDMIDWQTKHGMNGYFLQFDYGHFFWRSWYEHRTNSYWKSERCDLRRSKEIAAKVEREIKKRGLRFERVGHGWTCAAIGVPGEGWVKHDKPLAPGKRKLLAKVKGKRELFGGIAANTNLCYSNPDARKALTDSIVDYAKAHPKVDVLHFWLADGLNNSCECDDCKKGRPADFYVRMLNELDEMLSSARLSTKIVFLIYLDLLWPPKRERIKNPDRFLLMFAPITRSYLEPFAASQVTQVRMKPYERNNLRFPTGAIENLAHLQGWQKIFEGDGFDFDYHNIWACYYDPNQVTVAKVLHKDIQGLKSLGLAGLNSCQNQRCFFPHSLIMDVMARTLWNRRATFKEIAEASFADSFGNDAQVVFTFFKKMSELWKPLFKPALAPNRDKNDLEKGQRNLPKMETLVKSLRSTVQSNLGNTSGAVKWSWRYLKEYIDLLDLLLPAFDAYLHRSPDCRQKFEAAFDHLWRKEQLLHPVLDVSTFTIVLNWRIQELEGTISKERLTLLG